MFCQTILHLQHQTLSTSVHQSTYTGREWRHWDQNMSWKTLHSVRGCSLTEPYRRYLPGFYLYAAPPACSTHLLHLSTDRSSFLYFSDKNTGSVCRVRYIHSSWFVLVHSLQQTLNNCQYRTWRGLHGTGPGAHEICNILSHCRSWPLHAPPSLQSSPVPAPPLHTPAAGSSWWSWSFPAFWALHVSGVLLIFASLLDSCFCSTPTCSHLPCLSCLLLQTFLSPSLNCYSLCSYLCVSFDLSVSVCNYFVSFLVQFCLFIYFEPQASWPLWPLVVPATSHLFIDVWTFPVFLSVTPHFPITDSVTFMLQYLCLLNLHLLFTTIALLHICDSIYKPLIAFYQLMGHADVNGCVIFLLPFYFHHGDGEQNKSGAEWVLIILQIYIQMTFTSVWDINPTKLLNTVKQKKKNLTQHPKCLCNFCSQIDRPLTAAHFIPAEATTASHVL